MSHEQETATLIVDGANVMGSRADGWWRDRAGAMARLYGQLVGLAAAGIPGEPPAGRWWPRIVLVVEGRARAVIPLVSIDPRVAIVPAPGHGDDTIVEVAASTVGRRLVVTADQELRRRCESAGAEVTGPRWLTKLLEASPPSGDGT